LTAFAFAIMSIDMPAHAAATMVYVGNADSQDLSLFELDSAGRLTARGTVTVQAPAEPGRSMLLATAPNRRFLYATYLRGARSAVATYEIQRGTGLLTQVGGSTDLADIMSYTTTDRAGRFLLSASYGGNKVAVNRILANGSVGETLQTMDTAPKAHCIMTDPANRHVLHTALGGDVIYQDSFDASTGKLTAEAPPTVAVPANSGPRFLIFSRDGRFVYVIDELDGAIHVFSVGAAAGTSTAGAPSPGDSSAGTLRAQVQVSSTLPPGFTGQPWGADIHLTPDGHFLYTSERTSSTLAAFRVDPHSGTLTPLRWFPTVKQPRAFNIDPSGAYLISSGQLSNSVQVFSIAGASGELTPRAEYPVGKNPTWVEIVQLP
jgi:6-phosphogluconolactonase